tara:strand:+ start:43 stop:741 length:699 start_codon:yes stop_codon:yes gene_type:complete
MLNTVETSRANKTKGCAVTYRTASGKMYGTCPDTCNLKPEQTSTTEIDKAYLSDLIRAVPRRGWAWTYSHFHWTMWSSHLRHGGTVINYSADTIRQAYRAMSSGVPTVTVVGPDFWRGKGRRGKVIRCIAETSDLGCDECGGPKGPICARLDRDYIVGFTAHGPAKRKAADKAEKGGCYAGQGNCAVHWRHLAAELRDIESDGDKIRRFATGLRPGTRLRHHVAGDLGFETI